MFAAPQTTSSPHPVGVGGLGEVACALIIVLAAIFIVAWVVRRMRLVKNENRPAPPSTKDEGLTLHQGEADPTLNKAFQVQIILQIVEFFFDRKRRHGL